MESTFSFRINIFCTLTCREKIQHPNMYLFLLFPHGIFCSHLPRFRQACHYLRNISHLVIRARSRRNSEIIVSVYRSISIKYLPCGDKEKRRWYSDEGRQRRSSASLGLFRRRGTRDRERERRVWRQGEAARDSRIETENSISLPREPQARR